MIGKLLDRFARIFQYGRGRPVALGLLGCLLLANQFSEVGHSSQLPAGAAWFGETLGDPFRIGRQALFDGYQKQHPRIPQTQPVTIVAIDEASLTQMGQWPWPRNRTADLINAIAAHRPATVGLDIYMPEADETSPARVAGNLPPGNAALAEKLRGLPSHDSQLAAALRESPSVLGAAGFDFETLSTSAGMRTFPLELKGDGDPLPHVRSFPWVLASLPELQAAAKGQAVLSVDIESGIVRRMSLVVAVNGQMMAGLGMEMLRVATGEPITVTTGRNGIERVGLADLVVPTQPDGRIWLHFARFSAGQSRYVSAADVLAGKVADDMLAGKLVMVGLTGLGLNDQRITALGETVPGIEIQAQVVESVFDGRFVTRPAWMKWLEMLLAGIGAGLLIYLLPRGNTPFEGVLQILPRVSVWAVLALGGGLILAGDLLFVHAGLLFDASAVFIIVACVMGSLASSALIEISRRNEILAQEEQRMRETAAKAAGELSAAGRIQLGSLPVASRLFEHEHRFELAALLEPAKDVGGDLYDFFMIDDHLLSFVIGDVSGKGLPASIFMAVTKTLTKTIAKHVQAGPATVAKLVNEDLADVNPQMLFVTVLIGLLDIETGQVTLVNAGHDGPWRIRRNGEIMHLESPPEAGGPPLCVMDEFVYSAQQFQLEPGDALVMYTDGVTEAANPDLALYGNPRLAEVLSRCGTLPVQELIDRIRADVAAHVAGAEPWDDLTLLAIRWTPASG